MTRMTALIIQTDPSVFVEPYNEIDNDWGFVIMRNHKTPSDCDRFLPLLSSNCVYDSPEAAVADGNRIIQAIKDTVI
jgi:hypothetical protein